MYGQAATAARADCLVSGPRECTLFHTVNKRDGNEGRVFCARTMDDGKSWHHLTRPVPDTGRWGNPRMVQRPDGTVVTVYFLNDEPGGDRYIAAALWKP